MPISNIGLFFDWIKSRDEYKILFVAAFHICTITLVSMSMVGLPWFSISGGVCLEYLTLSDFFWYGPFAGAQNSKDIDCINSTLINIMRMNLVLCFLIIIVSLGGFFVNIFIPKKDMNKSFFKYGNPGISIVSVILIMIIISLGGYIILIMKESLSKLYPKTATDIACGPGVYLVASSGLVSLCGLLYTLTVVHDPDLFSLEDDQCLIDAFDDSSSMFNNLTPPPPYNVPPPPYTP